MVKFGDSVRVTIIGTVRQFMSDGTVRVDTDDDQEYGWFLPSTLMLYNKDEKMEEQKASVGKAYYRKGDVVLLPVTIVTVNQISPDEQGLYTGRTTSGASVGFKGKQVTLSQSAIEVGDNVLFKKTSNGTFEWNGKVLYIHGGDGMKPMVWIVTPIGDYYTLDLAMVRRAEA